MARPAEEVAGELQQLGQEAPGALVRELCKELIDGEVVVDALFGEGRFVVWSYADARPASAIVVMTPLRVIAAMAEHHQVWLRGEIVWIPKDEVERVALYWQDIATARVSVGPGTNAVSVQGYGTVRGFTVSFLKFGGRCVGVDQKVASYDRAGKDGSIR